MASFKNMSITNKGIALFTKTQAGALMKFTKMMVGSGDLGTRNPLLLTDLVDGQLDVPISSVTPKPEQKTATIVGNVDNAGLLEPLYICEIGIYAQDPDEGEILYGYSNCGQFGDYYAPETQGPFNWQYQIAVAIGNAANVTVELTKLNLDYTVMNTNTSFLILSGANQKEINKDIDNNLKTQRDSLLSLAGAGRTTETVKGNYDEIKAIKTNKVDKVTGKDLSTNDYTTAEKNKLLGIEVGATNYVHPATHPASMIAESTTKRFVTDTEKANWDKVTDKVDKVTGKVLSTNDFTTAEKNKLLGVETGATNYIHPATHPASMIIEAVNKRFMTDAERSKLDSLTQGTNYVHPSTHPASMIVEAVNKRFMTDAERNKLSSVETFANYYEHPSSHPASMIVEATTKRFVTDAEKASLGNVIVGSYIGTGSTLRYVAMGKVCFRLMISSSDIEVLAFKDTGRNARGYELLNGNMFFTQTYISNLGFYADIKCNELNKEYYYVAM